jgi:hypothetical protein
LKLLFRPKKAFNQSFRIMFAPPHLLQGNYEFEYKNLLGYLDNFQFGFHISSDKSSCLRFAHEFPILKWKKLLTYDFTNVFDQSPAPFPLNGNKKTITISSWDRKTNLSFALIRRKVNFKLFETSANAMQNEIGLQDKYMLSLDHIVSDTLHKQDNKLKGDKLEIFSQLGYVHGSLSLKSGVEYHKYFEPIHNYLNWGNKENLSLKYQDICPEIHSELGVILPLFLGKRKSNWMHDRFYLSPMRGFNFAGERVSLNNAAGKPKTYGEHPGSDILWQSSLKLNFHNFPLFSDGALPLVPFLHCSHAFLSGPLFGTNIKEQREPFKGFRDFLVKTNRVSTGLGVTFSTYKSSRFELLYNFGHFFKGQHDQTANLQFRFSYGD